MDGKTYVSVIHRSFSRHVANDDDDHKTTCARCRARAVCRNIFHVLGSFGNGLHATASNTSKPTPIAYRLGKLSIIPEGGRTSVVVDTKTRDADARMMERLTSGLIRGIHFRI